MLIMTLLFEFDPCYEGPLCPRMKNLGASSRFETLCHKFDTGWGLSCPYEIQKLYVSAFRRPRKSPLKIPSQNPLCLVCQWYPSLTMSGKIS